MLRGTNEHLDQVIVQAVEDLALEGPLKLRIVEIARMQIVVVSMNFGLSESGTEYHLNPIALGARAERDQRMLIELELIEYLSEAVRGHTRILKCRTAG